jgi:hypothetical protein
MQSEIGVLLGNFLGAFPELRKANVKFIMSVSLRLSVRLSIRLSVRVEQLGSHSLNLTSVFFQKPVRKIQV